MSVSACLVLPCLVWIKDCYLSLSSSSLFLPIVCTVTNILYHFCIYFVWQGHCTLIKHSCKCPRISQRLFLIHLKAILLFLFFYRCFQVLWILHFVKWMDNVSNELPVHFMLFYGCIFYSVMPHLYFISHSRSHFTRIYGTRHVSCLL